MHTRSIMRLASTVLLLAFLSPVIHAVTLADAVRAAVERHPDYPLAGAYRKVEAGYRQQANALFGGDPSMNISATGDTLGTGFGYEEYVAGISVPVWLPGQRAAKRAIADSMALLATRELHNLTWTVSGEVLERAWALRIAKSDMKQSMKQWAAARALLKDIRHRHEVGELSRNDLLLAQQDLVDAESAHQEALNTLQEARLAWINYTGLDDLPEDLESFSTPVQEGSLDQHPQIRAARAAADAAAAKARDARAQRRAAPVISLFAKRDRGARQEDYTDSLGIGFSLPLGTRAASAPAVTGAEAERTRAEAQANLLLRKLELRLARAEQAQAKAEKLLQLAKQKYDYSHSRLNLAQRAFELGEMDLYQLLQARRQYYQAIRDLKLRQLKKAHAAARRNHVTGVIPQ